VSGIREAAGWLATNLWWLPLAIALRYVVALAGDRFSTRVRERSDRHLRVRVELAACRLPAPIRAAYEREWLAELQHVLHGPHARPVVRLWHGMRFAQGLRRAARHIARSHEPPRMLPHRFGRAVIRGAGATFAVVVGASLVVAAAVLVATSMVAIAVWAALAGPVRWVRTGGGPVAAFRVTYVDTCRVLGVSWFGWPRPDPPGEQTLLAIGDPWDRP
jgi:hypothetical protein